MPTTKLKPRGLVPNAEVIVYTTADATNVLGNGTVHKIAPDGTVEVHLSWKLADGRPAALYTQPACLRVKAAVTKVGAEVTILNADRGVFVKGGRVVAVRNPDMVKVALPWDLADGTPATMYTPAANLESDKETIVREARKKKVAAIRHMAKFRKGVKLMVMDQHGGVFAPGTMAEQPYPSKPTYKIQLHWLLADGTNPRLYVSFS